MPEDCRKAKKTWQLKSKDEIQDRVLVGAGCNNKAPQTG